MKEQINQSPEKIKLEESQLRQLSSEEKQTLLAALNTARETVKPTVKRLMESESVSNDILTMRLDNAAVRRSTGACNAI